MHVTDSLQDYIIQLVNATRQNPDVALGASSRASLALFKAAQALAAIQGRDFVLPDDIQRLVLPVLTHGLVIAPESILRGATSTKVIQSILQHVKLELSVLLCPVSSSFCWVRFWGWRVLLASRFYLL